MAERKKKIAGEARPYHKGNVAEDLKKVALRLLQTERFEDISARRLCREVGVTYANFYNHFPSFDYLMLDIAADAFEARAESNRRLLERAGSQAQAMLDIAAATVEFAVTNPQLFRIMFGQIEPKNAPARFEIHASASLRVLAQAVGAKAVSPRAYTFFAFTQGLARIVSQNLVEGNTSTPAARRRFVREVMAQFSAGFSGPPAPKKTPAAR